MVTASAIKYWVRYWGKCVCVFEGSITLQNYQDLWCMQQEAVAKCYSLPCLGVSKNVCVSQVSILTYKINQLFE